MSKESPRTLTDEECTQLLNCLLAGPYGEFPRAKGFRNYCMGILMLDAGLRVGEVVKLTVSALWYGAAAVSAIEITADIAKGGRSRTVPVTARLKKAIESIREIIWETDTIFPQFFAFYASNPKHSLTVRSVEGIIGRAGDNACHRKITPHMLRHTFATRLMAKTNLRVVQELLGHKKLSSTEIYTHPNHQDKVEAISQLDTKT